MPRFHLHVHKDVHARDEEGAEFPDLAVVKASVLLDARSLIADRPRMDGRFHPNHAIKITDADGLTLHVTRYDECVAVHH